MILEISNKEKFKFIENHEGCFVCKINESQYYWISFSGNSFVLSASVGIGFCEINKAISFALDQPAYAGLPVLMRLSNDLVGVELGSIFSKTGISNDDKIRLAESCFDAFYRRYSDIDTVKKAIDVVILEQIYHPSAKILYPTALMVAGMEAEFKTFSELFIKMEVGSAKSSYSEFLRRLNYYFSEKK
ncbi:hypothetical protein ACFPIF_11630 [Brevundimonas faecalis]|uniref:hypothetical protein n=1 Tax=Brevundimonas faecalis TaxID=947378 RepID=UPI0036101163